MAVNHGCPRQNPESMPVSSIRNPSESISLEACLFSLCTCSLACPLQVNSDEELLSLYMLPELNKGSVFMSLLSLAYNMFINYYSTKYTESRAAVKEFTCSAYIKVFMNSF